MFKQTSPIAVTETWLPSRDFSRAPGYYSVTQAEIVLLAQSFVGVCCKSGSDREDDTRRGNSVSRQSVNHRELTTFVYIGGPKRTSVMSRQYELLLKRPPSVFAYRRQKKRQTFNQRVTLLATFLRLATFLSAREHRGRAAPNWNARVRAGKT